MGSLRAGVADYHQSRRPQACICLLFHLIRSSKCESDRFTQCRMISNVIRSQIVFSLVMLNETGICSVKINETTVFRCVNCWWSCTILNFRFEKTLFRLKDVIFVSIGHIISHIGYTILLMLQIYLFCEKKPPKDVLVFKHWGAL